MSGPVLGLALGAAVVRLLAVPADELGIGGLADVAGLPDGGLISGGVLGVKVHARVAPVPLLLQGRGLEVRDEPLELRGVHPVPIDIAAKDAVGPVGVVPVPGDELGVELLDRVTDHGHVDKFALGGLLEHPRGPADLVDEFGLIAGAHVVHRADVLDRRHKNQPAELGVVPDKNFAARPLVKKNILRPKLRVKLEL